MKPENITILTVVDYSVSRDAPSALVTVIAFTLFRVLSICVAHPGFEEITNGCIT